VKFSIPVIGSVAFLAFQCCLPTVASAQSLGTPQFTSSSIAGCDGSFILTWSAITGATSYEVWAELPGTSSFVISKLPTTTLATVHAQPGGITLFEVSACDASGCGGLSSSIGLSWYSGCP
jgi:hypothetical protein